jgi:hypothetical protein
VPAVVSILSAGVVGLSGFAVWLASGAHIRDPYLRGILAALTVLCPVVGLEAIDSAAYVPWYMLFATFWLLIWRPATTWGTVFASAFILLTGLSSPGIWFFAPLAALRAVAARDRRDGAIATSFAVGAAVQIPIVLSNREQAIDPAWSHDIWSTYLQRVIDGAPLGLRLGGNAWEQLGWPLLIGLALAGVIGFYVGFRRSGASARWIAAIALLTSLTMFVVSLYERAAAEQMVWPEGIWFANKGDRYVIVPALLLVSAAMALIDSAQRKRAVPGRIGRAGAATVALLALALVTSFDQRQNALRGDPSWDAALEWAEAECVTERVAEIWVPISPPGWGLQLSCNRLTSFAAVVSASR